MTLDPVLEASRWFSETLRKVTIEDCYNINVTFSVLIRVFSGRKTKEAS
jgi:hypothetical protein